MGNLIIHADDYGISHEVNLAICKGIKDGIIDRAKLMINMPFTEEAVSMATDNAYLDKIGLHLNLVEGRPITEKIKNTWLCKNGFFNGEISNKKYKNGFIKDKNILLCLAEEIDAQMKQFISWNMPLLHLDSHQHAHIKPSLFPIVMRAAKENGFQSIRLASIIPSDSPKMPVVIYKSYINRKIMTFNIQNFKGSIFPIVNVGCAYLSLMKQTKKDEGNFIKENSIEMWFHPSLVDGKIVNLFCKGQFNINNIQWLRRQSAGEG